MKPRERLIQAAALVIRQDAKLLGIPSVRPRLIEDAVRVGTSRDRMPDRIDYKGLTHEDNLPAVLSALHRAVAAVRSEHARLSAGMPQ